MVATPEQILSQLTLQEKILLTAGKDYWHTNPVPRLDIPSLRLSDGPNGVRGTQFFDPKPSGCFPSSTGLGATFDKSLAQEAGKLMAAEARAKGVHVILGPTINIIRNPLGGRGFETFSEDPILTGQLGAAVVQGIQSQGIAACVKHFVANDIEHYRLKSNSIVSRRALREVYIRPFEIAIRESHPETLMTSYNKTNGIHCSQDVALLKLLRTELGFEGLVMSDWCGTFSVAAAYVAGLDLEMPGAPRFRRVDTVEHMVASAELLERDIDASALRVLRLAEFCRGSGIPENAPETAENDTADTRAHLRSIDAQGIVLLKNDSRILPLSPSDSVAVIGPNAFHASVSGGGSAALRSYPAATPLEAISEVLTKPPLSHQGCFSHKKVPDTPLINPVTGEQGINMKIYVDPPSSPDRSLVDERNLDSTHISMYDYYHPQIHEFQFYADIEGDFKAETTGEYDFGIGGIGEAELFVDGELVAQTGGEVPFSALLNEDFPEQHGTLKLEKGKLYRITVKFASSQTTENPPSLETGGGACVFGVFPVKDPEELIAEACAVAQKAEKVILCIGTSADWESEGHDRSDLRLPKRTDDLVRAVAAANPQCVVVNFSGCPVEMPWVAEVPAVVQAWFGGTEGSRATADVLFGKVNPSGKLPMTFPRSLLDVPSALTFKTDGGDVVYGEDIFVGYRNYEGRGQPVLFPFGHGLSYSTFEYTAVSAVETAERLEVSVEVRNISKVAGAAVVQYYVAAPSHEDVLRPLKQLVEFDKVEVASEGVALSKVVIDKREAAKYWDGWTERWCCLAGEYNVLIGDSSANMVTEAKFVIKKTFFC